MDEIINLLDSICNEFHLSKNDTIYLYNNIPVPRVTKILDAMLHEDSLMGWSNYIGLYKKEKYKDILERAANIGSTVHESIERHIQYNEPLDINKIKSDYINEVQSAYYAFSSYWDILCNNNVKVLMQEQKLVCKYFGGTLDLLVEINGKIYLIDFKTSNHLNYKYFYQLAAYRYMLRLNYNIEIDGCIVLMLSKTTGQFEENILHMSIPEHKQYLDICEQTFLSLVYGYYNREYSYQMYKNIFKGGY